MRLANVPISTQIMNLTSKYRNAQIREGKCPTLRKSRRFMCGFPRWRFGLTGSPDDRQPYPKHGQPWLGVGCGSDKGGGYLLQGDSAEFQFRLPGDRVGSA